MELPAPAPTVPEPIEPTIRFESDEQLWVKYARDGLSIPISVSTTVTQTEIPAVREFKGVCTYVGVGGRGVPVVSSTPTPTPQEGTTKQQPAAVTADEPWKKYLRQ